MAGMKIPKNTAYFGVNQNNTLKQQTFSHIQLPSLEKSIPTNITQQIYDLFQINYMTTLFYLPEVCYYACFTYKAQTMLEMTSTKGKIILTKSLNAVI